MNTKNKTARQKRKFSIRKKIIGSAERPRLSVFKSNRHFTLQAIDDVSGKTVVSVHTLEKGLKGKTKYSNLKGAKEAAAILAGRAKEKGIKQMVFDRNGYLYHGKVKQIAESLRENGIQI